MSVKIKDINGDQIKVRELTMMENVLNDMQIHNSNSRQFGELCGNLITAITSPSIRMGMFNISPYKFSRVLEKPKKWDETYTKYYMFDEDKASYVKYRKKMQNADGVKNDKKEQISQVPEWNDNVYRKVPVDETEEIRKIRSKYGRIVREFVIPYFKKYQNAFRSSERNEIAYVIEHTLKAYIITGIYPTESEIESTRNEYSNINGHEISVRLATVGMLTYKDKVLIAKKNFPKCEEESDDAYNARIDKLIRDNEYNQPHRRTTICQA